MRNGTIASLLVIAVLGGAGAGYLVGGQVTKMKTVTTTVTGQCPLAIATEHPTNGFSVEISYQGPWNATVSTYSSIGSAAPAYLLSKCQYGGSGVAYLYVPPTGTIGGGTVIGAAHKLDSSNGTLTVTVSYGGLSRMNSTALPLGSTTTFLAPIMMQSTSTT